MSTIHTIRTETEVPITLTLSKSGPVTGATAVYSVRDGDVEDSWLDFNDMTFKAAGWTTLQSALTESTIQDGLYTANPGLDLTAITNLSANTKHLIVVYEVTAPALVASTTMDMIFIDDTETNLTADHGAGSWQQSVVTGAALNTVANSDSVVTIGNVVSGTYLDSQLLDDIYWQIADVGGQIDMYYEFLIPSDGVPSTVSFDGRVSGSGDDLDVLAYNWGDTQWEQIGTLEGKNSPSDELSTYNMFAQHIGTGGDLGKVRVRFYTAAGLTNANFYTDQIILGYAIVNRSVGYADGAIWIDTIDGVDGSTVFINGVADNPVKTWANALSLSAALKIKRFRVAGGSSLILTGNSDNFHIIGIEYDLDLNGQSIANAFVEGATVHGTGAGLDARFRACRLLALSLTRCVFNTCGLTDVLTLLSAGPYVFDNCLSAVAGTGSPVIDFGAAADTQLNLRHYSGGVEVRNMGTAGDDAMSLEGHGQIIIAASCTGGVIAIRGHFTVTDNAGGAMTLSDDARYEVNQITAAIWGISEVQLAAAGETGELLLFGNTLRSSIDFSGNDLLGWQLVVYDRNGTEISRANLYDHAFARIPASKTVLDFIASKDTIARVTKI
jgi:hypothetical protein